ncbi:MAG: MFS transporter [Pseudomonas sp.]|uniref:MFS transporter n=1 Tax=Pseudomonas sp. TaxID=306 RepID=UPI003398A279
MTRLALRRRLALAWWAQLGLTLAPLFLINLLLGTAPPLLPVLAMPLFIAALTSMFVSLPLFRRFKQALIATEKALDSADEPAAWMQLARVRRQAFLAAGLPAWIAAGAVLVGLNAIAQVLLALSSLVLLTLYRIPRQLG